ncbi:hypothetical protein RFI_10485 [Reticulomyxa filosa]|uniref:Uncharacterized protein n=1 Tax=Reticulomyxa filosa TaxID=46433 RepID=X6NL54_RETFI|nr:hypothetical protein RFI_10485 [Reticulomyxa filosa]|eukprot:ETO26648.1 hypothetical protein RFI_10485 [Reticulomyxa filosa]
MPHAEPNTRFPDIEVNDFIDIYPLTHPGWKIGQICRMDSASGQVQVMYNLHGQSFLYWTHLNNVDEVAPFMTKVEETGPNSDQAQSQQQQSKSKSQSQSQSKSQRSEKRGSAALKEGYVSGSLDNPSQNSYNNNNNNNSNNNNNNNSNYNNNNNNINNTHNNNKNNNNYNNNNNSNNNSNATKNTSITRASTRRAKKKKEYPKDTHDHDVLSSRSSLHKDTITKFLSIANTQLQPPLKPSPKSDKHVCLLLFCFLCIHYFLSSSVQENKENIIIDNLIIPCGIGGKKKKKKIQQFVSKAQDDEKLIQPSEEGTEGSGSVQNLSIDPPTFTDTVLKS